MSASSVPLDKQLSTADYSTEYGHGLEYHYDPSLSSDLASHEEVAACLIAFSSSYYWETDSEHRVTRVASGNSGEAARAARILIGFRRWECGTVPMSGSWIDHQATLDRRESFRNFLVTDTAPDGSVRNFSISGQPRCRSDGRFLGYIGVSREVTDDFYRQKLAGLELQLLQLLASVVHESRLYKPLSHLCEVMNWDIARYWDIDDSGESVVLKLSTTQADSRPWLGLYATEVEDKVVIVGLADNGPAQRANLRTGDLVISVDGVEVDNLAGLFRRIWAQGEAGVEVPMLIYRDGKTFEVKVPSSDRGRFLKRPSMH
jgi:hypothetical protein